MRNTIKHIVGSTWQPFLIRYLSKTRIYTYKNIRLQIPATVFHPGFFFSTHLLLNQLKNFELGGKRLLEPGAGSGLLSIYAAREGAKVMATDISPHAVECVRENAEANGVTISVRESDLFDNIPPQLFDIIVINPPYYRKQPLSFAEYAWNCGENGEYFQKLFRQLPAFIHPGTAILMVLCDACDIDMVQSQAVENGFAMQVIFTKQNIIEKNFIYSIQLKTNGEPG